MNLNILDNKSKTTLLFVHGYGSSGNAIDVIKKYKLNFNIISFSYPDEKIKNVQDVARKIDTIIKKINGPIVLMGHSLGGAIISHVKNKFKIKKYIYASALTPIMANNKGIKFLNKQSNGNIVIKKIVADSLTKIGYENIAQFLNPPDEWKTFAEENILNIDYLIGVLNKNYMLKAKKSISLIGKKDIFFKYEEYKKFMDQNNIPCYLIKNLGHNIMSDNGEKIVEILNKEIIFKKRSGSMLKKDV